MKLVIPMLFTVLITSCYVEKSKEPKERKNSGGVVSAGLTTEEDGKKKQISDEQPRTLEVNVHSSMNLLVNGQAFSNADGFKADAEKMIRQILNIDAKDSMVLKTDLSRLNFHKGFLLSLKGDADATTIIPTTQTDRSKFFVEKLPNGLYQVRVWQMVKVAVSKNPTELAKFYCIPLAADWREDFSSEVIIRRNVSEFKFEKDFNVCE